MHFGVAFSVVALSVLVGCGRSEDKQVSSPSTPGKQSASSATVAGVPAATMQRGKQIYESYCRTCHQANAQGIPGMYPPLAGSDFLTNKQQVIHALVFGLSGPITVKGKTYNGVMPPAPYNDEDIAAVLTYVYNSFGNPGGIVTAEEVAAVRKAGKQAAQ